MGLDPRGLSVAEFQFTHPGRGATIKDLNRRHPRTVSIHAPREGCDYFLLPNDLYDGRFQFTHPGRGATISEVVTTALTEVSIHAPREGCDKYLGREVVANCGFQFTHPGRGATRLYLGSHPNRNRFNSRTPGGVRLYPRYITDFS